LHLHAILSNPQVVVKASDVAVEAELFRIRGRMKKSGRRLSWLLVGIVKHMRV
jgi:hypothetical protein